MSTRSHWLRIFCLLILAGVVQGWMVGRNQIPAQDAVSFVQFARQFDHEPLRATLQRNPQHPLFPMLVWFGHHSLAGLTGDGAAAWLHSAQCVAAVAAVLLVVPMYLAGVRLANPTLATGATSLFSMLPFAARLGADALSDSTHLLFLLVAFWSATEFLATRRPTWLLVSGLATGLGYLARPEALLIGVAVSATLCAMQVRREWRFAWRELFAAAALFGCGVLLTAAPYAGVTGALTPKGSVTLLPGGEKFATEHAAEGDEIRTAQLSDGRVVAARLGPVLGDAGDAELDFGLKHRPASERFEGFAPAVRELTRELVEGLHYLFGLLVLVGVVRSPRQPANLFASASAIVFIVVLVLFASRAGYLASRHVLVLVCLGSYVAARGGWMLAGGLVHLACVLHARWSRASGIVGFGNSGVVAQRQLRAAVAILIASGAFCLPRNLLPLHPSRAAHANAGRWLADHAAAGSLVLDSRGWAALYSGLPAYSYHGARIAVQDDRLAYVIVERDELENDRPRGITLRCLLDRAGERLAEFEAPDSSDSVLIYGWHPEFLVRSRTVERAPSAN